MRLPQDRILHIDTELAGDEVRVVAEWQGELVRCKECRKKGSDDCPMFSREWRTIMRGNECVDDFVFHDLAEPSGFCNYGERREE